MPKKYIYELKELNDLFHTKCAEIDPDNNPVRQAQMLTPTKKTQMFQEIINDYGARGWRLLSSHTLSSSGADGPLYFIFEKEVYATKEKKTAVKKTE